jgi:hypothetical protein
MGHGFNSGGLMAGENFDGGMADCNIRPCAGPKRAFRTDAALRNKIMSKSVNGDDGY